MTGFGIFILFIGAIALIALLVRLKELRGMVKELGQRVTALERQLQRPVTRPAPPKIPVPPSPLLVPPPLPEPSPPAATERAAKQFSPHPSKTPAKLAIDWEIFMGVKMFAWLGGLALFLGIVFLIKYSFENNLITPLGRVVLGATVSAIAIGAGWWLARGRYRTTAQSLCATGLVILYADLFAAHSYYLLISLTTAFFALSAVTLFAFLLALALDGQVIVILGLLGGFLTPFLLRSGVDQAPALFTYVALLDFGVAAVALRKRWHYLVLLAAIGTAVTEVAWSVAFFQPAKAGRAFWIFLGAEAIFVLLSFLERLSRPNEKWTFAAIGITGAAALGFCIALLSMPMLAREPFYFFSFVFLADAGLVAPFVFSRTGLVLAVIAAAAVFALLAGWILSYAEHVSLGSALLPIVIFALLHAATTPASAFARGKLPLTATATITPFVLLIMLIGTVKVLNPTPIFLVTLILSAILLTAAIVRRADWLAASALLGAWLTELTWQNERFTNDEMIPTLVWYGLFLILFVLYPFCSAQKEKAWPWAISALAQAGQFWLFYRVLVLNPPNEWMGLLPAAFILPALVGVIALRKNYHAEPATGNVRLAWQGGALLLFISLIFPLQFHREWITLGWAIEGLALLLLFHRVPHRGLRFVGVILLCAAFVRLALNPAVLQYHRRTGAGIWNWYLYAYGITTACLLGGARIFGRAAEKSIDRFGPPILGSLGVILAFLLLNLEIADYFSIGPTLTFSFSGNFARDMTYSIAWALFALGLIIVGIRIRQRAARYAGVALLGITLAKLFLHDLNDLAELYRIGAFIGVALILIAASFIYQRFLAPERAH